MRANILLIEDNADDVLLTRKALKDAGVDYRLDAVNHAKEGLSKMLETDYDLVLCDYLLPGSSALEIMKESKKQGKDIPFVVVTALGSEKTAVSLMKEGAYDYVVKDVSYSDTLPMVIKMTIEKHSAEKEKRRLEGAIKQAAQEWRVTFDSITDLVSIVDRHFKLLRVNKAFADAFRMRPQDVVGKTCYELMRGNGVKEMHKLCPHKQTMKTKKSTSAEFFEPNLGIYLEVSASPIFDDKGEVVGSVHIAKDITQRKELENSQRLAQLGKLAADMAHELNNPLMVISGRAQLSLMENIENGEIKNNLSIIRDECQRAKDIIQRVLKFSKPSKGDLKKVDINKSLDGLLAIIIEHQFKLGNVEIKRDYAENLPPVLINEKQIHEVFVNLLTNAFEAISGSGVIEITTRNDGHFLRIDFKDTGSGMDEETLTKAFGPFFTTKEKGTGLGLAICYGIIKNHNGELKLQSSPGKGTIATILLPIEQSVS